MFLRVIMSLLMMFMVTHPLYSMMGNFDYVVEYSFSYGFAYAQRLFKDPRQNELFKALYSHNSEKVKQLIKRGANVNEKDNSGISFLWQVIDERKSFSEKKLHELIDLLLEKGVTLDFAVGANKATVVHQVVAYKQIPVLEKLIQAGALINAQNAYGSTALHNAARKNESGLVALLLSRGADHRIKNNSGKSAYDCTSNKIIKKMIRDRGFVVNSITISVPTSRYDQAGLHAVLRVRAVDGKCEENGVKKTRLMLQVGEQK